MWLEKQLYSLLIHSNLVYCHLIWGMCNNKDSNRLQYLQRKDLRLVYPTSQTERSIFHILKILSLAELYSFLAIFLYRQIKNNLAPCFGNHLKREVVFNLRTNYLIGPRHRTNYGSRTIHHRIISLLRAILP